MKKMRGFTVIEMLVVLAIMGIILAISVPAFDSVLKTTKVKQGAKLIYKTLEFARQYAVTHGTDCMVAFATTDPGGSDYKMAYRAYKVYLPDEEATIEDWQFLFRGTEIDDDAAKSTFLVNTDDIPFPNDGDGTASVAYVRFTPAGVPTTMKTISVVDSNDDTVFREVTYSNISGWIRLKDLGDD